MKKSYFGKNTFHHGEFSDLKKLVDKKEEKDLKISLCFPTLNEEKTIGSEIMIMQSELIAKYPLLDEVIVVDSGSTDNTRQIARDCGVSVFKADDILPHLNGYKGKGENLWKALHVTMGDIILYLDSDIKNIHHRFAYGLIGPLLMSDDIKFTKAFYDRPIFDGNNKLKPTGGGRVTELVIRPLFSLFFPELTRLMQPLSGEYAGYREIFEAIPFPIGYGIETSMNIDIYKKWGIDIIGQVDLDKRIHKNQTTTALGLMSFAILKTFLDRIQKLGHIELKKDVHDHMIRYSLEEMEVVPDIKKLDHIERPPIIEIPEYLEKFKKGPLTPAVAN